MNYCLMEERDMKKNILILLLMKITFGVMPLQSAGLDPEIDSINGIFGSEFNFLFALGLSTQGVAQRDEGFLNPEPAISVNEPIEMADESSALTSKFVCKACDRRFIFKYDLKIHERTHTGKRPFACTSCDRRFTQMGSLETHERTHTGEKPFACTSCGRRFNQNGNLKTHERTHTGEKPFACTSCGRRFYQKGNLKMHERTQHSESQAS